MSTTAYSLSQVTTILNDLLARVAAIDGHTLPSPLVGSICQLSKNIVSIKQDLNQLAANFTDQLNTVTASINSLTAAATGPQGVTGESAYQVALDNGFEGTQDQWLASLQASLTTIPDTGLLIVDASNGHTYIITSVDGVLTTTLTS